MNINTFNLIIFLIFITGNTFKSIDRLIKEQNMLKIR